jgi:DNA-binding beta-propeller fold protein YncE
MAILRRGNLRQFVLAICVMVVPVFALKAGTQENPPLKLIATTPMPDFTGDFDHFGVDLKGKRLFLAAEEHQSVEVFELQTGKRITSIANFEQPHVMVYLPGSNTLVVTDGDKGGQLALVSGKDYSILKTIKLPPGVDHGAFNPVKNHYYVETGPEAAGADTHLLQVVDLNGFKVIGKVVLPGKSNEGMVIDHAGKKLYVNLTGTDEVGVIDLDAGQLIARWPLPDAHVAHAIALDEQDHRLFTVTRKPAKLIVFDMETGKVVSDMHCVDVNSDAWYDAARKRIYVTGSDTASVFAQRDADHYEHVAEVPTAYRAKSSIFVPQLNRLYIAFSSKGKADAKMALQIYEVQ